MKVLIIFSLAILNIAAAYKILIYSPKFGTSHVNFMGKLADILVRAGHDVTAYEPIVDEDCTTNGTKLAKIIIREKDFEAPKNADTKIQSQIWTIDDFSTISDLMNIIRISHGNLCKKQLNDEKLMDSLKAEKFDIALGEAFDLCYYGVLKRIGINNYITVSSTGVFRIMSSALGIPSTPSFVPSLFASFKPPFSYLERVESLFHYIMEQTAVINLIGTTSMEAMHEKFGNDFDFVKQAANSALYLVNVDEHVGFPSPTSHKIVYIGGVGKVQSKPLDKKYEEIMKNSKKGVILVSFGTVALSHNMPHEVKKIFLESFKKFPDVTFIWKYEKDEDKIAEGYKNVVTEKWVPQNDLLEHPKLLGFVSHGGMNSIQEGATKGVPMIMIPLFGDQIHNSKMLEYRKMAISLSKNQLTVEKLAEAFKTIIEDDSYRKNAKRLSALIASKPMDAEERVVKYTEFAAKFGPNLNLDLHGKHLNFVEFYCLDIILPAILLVVAILYIVYRLLRLVFRTISNILFNDKKKQE